MSLRVIYQRIPASQRVCTYYRCRKPILRNIDRDKDGCLYHHGCLMRAQDERYRCLECYAIFDATQAVLLDDFGKTQLACPSCGCTNLRRF